MQFLAKTRKVAEATFSKRLSRPARGGFFVPQQKVLAKIKKAPQSVKGML